jgi:hypothetical protein
MAVCELGGAMGSDVAAEPGLSYELVLEAVQESSRGRWFLEEFKARNAKTESKSILDAIAKLETRMESMFAGVNTSGDLARVKEAIAATKRDILRSAGAPGLSEEAQLFSHLADLARTALARQNDGGTVSTIPSGIVHALKLVEKIDNVLGGKIPAEEAFFRRDQDIFEEASKQKPVLAPVPEAVVPASNPVSQTSAVVDMPQLGAKLVINKKGRRETKTEVSEQLENATDTAPVTSEAPAPANAEPPVQEGEQHAGSRIVIIRRKPEDMPDVSSPYESDKSPFVETAA